MKLTTENITPHLARLKSREITQTDLAIELGIGQGKLSSFLKRKGLLDDVRVGRGGLQPTAPGMALALEEALSANNTAEVARKHGVDYLALARRVKRRRDAAVKAAPTRANEATVDLLMAAIGHRQ